MSKEIYSQIFKQIKSSNNILLATHENPDGDALASMCAMYEFLHSLNKDVFLFCHDKPERSFDFLPHIEHVQRQSSNIHFDNLDLIIIVDCASLRRTKIEEKLLNLDCPIINIDHHASNNNFGNLNLVDGKTVATTQIIYELFKSQQIEINKNMANCIMTGIFTDSGNFAYTATNSSTFDIASEMLIKGASMRDIINNTSKNKNLPSLKIWGLALSRLQHNKAYDIAYTVLSKADLEEYGVDKEDLEGLSNFLNNLKDAKIVMVLHELDDGRVKGSFRTTRDNVNVSKLAQVLGGGGHIKAAGFEVEGSLEKINGSWQVV